MKSGNKAPASHSIAEGGRAGHITAIFLSLLHFKLLTPYLVILLL